MRKLGWALLLGLAFSIPWEYSLDLGAPFGNISRVLGILLVLAMGPAVLQTGRIRNLTALHWLVLSLVIWFALTYFWSIDPKSTLDHARGSVQEVMIFWFVSELIDTPEQLRDLFRCYVAGCCVLAVLTVANFASPDAAGQIRFAAPGQDPNDVARFLDLGFPLGACLLHPSSRWTDNLLAAAYLPLGFMGVLLTASRAGLIAAVVALAGCAWVLVRTRSHAVTVLGLSLLAVLGSFWLAVPQETFDRLLTIPEQLTEGDLNLRLNIWAAGWQAVVHAPFAGSGAGTFSSAAGLGPLDTAHNTALAMTVEGGMSALLLASGIAAMAAIFVVTLRGTLRVAIGTASLVWVVTSLVATVQENRQTWLLLGVVAVAHRLTAEQPGELARTFSERALPRRRRPAAALATE